MITYSRLFTLQSRKIFVFCALCNIYSDVTNPLFSSSNYKESIICRKCAGQCNRPAGDDYYYQGQNHVPKLDFVEKTLDKAKIYSENSDNECQDRCENHYTAQKTTGRLDIEGFENSALSEGKRSGSHSAGRTRQTGPLLEAAVTEPSTHIDFIMSRQCKYSEENNYPQAHNRRDFPLAGRGTVEKSRLMLLAFLHNYVKIGQRNRNVKIRGGL